MNTTFSPYDNQECDNLDSKIRIQDAYHMLEYDHSYDDQTVYQS